MKIIRLYKNEKQLIAKAVDGDRQAQRTIYERFSPKMLGVCRQYIKDVQFAEDVMVGGFVKVFKNLKTFGHRGSFEGWIRKIMVRECISHLRKKQFVVYGEEADEHMAIAEENQTSVSDVEHIQHLIDGLPEGYKMVFVLYAVEGYKHEEIAQLLQISVGTSKSQLFKARKMLQENLRLMGITPRTKSRGQ